MFEAVTRAHSLTSNCALLSRLHSTTSRPLDLMASAKIFNSLDPRTVFLEPSSSTLRARAYDCFIFMRYEWFSVLIQACISVSYWRILIWNSLRHVRHALFNHVLAISTPIKLVSKHGFSYTHKFHAMASHRWERNLSYLSIFKFFTRLSTCKSYRYYFFEFFNSFSR